MKCAHVLVGLFTKRASPCEGGLGRGRDPRRARDGGNSEHRQARLPRPRNASCAPENVASKRSEARKVLWTRDRASYVWSIACSARAARAVGNAAVRAHHGRRPRPPDPPRRLPPPRGRGLPPRPPPD